MRSLTSALFVAALTTASCALAGAAPNQPAPPHWSAGWFIPQGTVLPRDLNRPPAVIGFSFKMTPPTGWSVTWTNNVQSHGMRLTQEVSPAQGAGHLFFRIDPCKVAGLDTPGTEIAVNYEFVFTATQPNGVWKPPVSKGTLFLKLAQDTVAPMINTLNAPSTAYRDQTIQVTLSATDISDEIGGDLVWDSGLRTFRLEGPANPGGSGLQTKQVDESVPQTCGEKVKKERHVFSYTIPHSAQPGDVIKLRAEAIDWSGNVGTQETTVKIVDKPKPDTPFPPRAGCTEVRGTTTHYQGIGGTCTGVMFICSENFKVACDPQRFIRPSAVMGRENGPEVCCDDWKKARQSKKPCDVAVDSDCDGIPNSKDNAPMYKGNTPPPPARDTFEFFKP